MRQSWIKNGIFWAGLLVFLGLLPFFFFFFHLNLVITKKREDLTNKAHGKAIWLDIAYDIPSSMNPVLLEYKLHSAAVLQRAVGLGIPAFLVSHAAR